MPKWIDLTGQRFGRLLIVTEDGRSKNGGVTWLCDCDCGEQTIVTTSALHGLTRSCGCLKRENASRIGKLTDHKLHHGHSRGRKKVEGGGATYSSWGAMKARCSNPNQKAFKNYGGRGIKVCDRWLNSFEAFLADMGERPEGKTLDRINNDCNYEPGNCRWATKAEQAKNQGSHGPPKGRPLKKR